MEWKTVAIVSGCTGRLWPDGSRVALWRGEKANVIEIWNLPELMKAYPGNHSPLEAAMARPPVRPDPATAARNECVDNQHRIDAAKQCWALDQGKHSTDTPSLADLEPYWGTNHWQPKCPAGGTYTIGTMGEKPKCSLAEHALP
jgi:hypothetical protein